METRACDERAENNINENGYIKFIDSISFLPFPLRKLSSACGLTAAKVWYPHYFNTQENLDYVGSIHDPSHYGIDEMSAGERREFLECYSTIDTY